MGQAVKVVVGFSPKDSDQVHHSVLMVRNNLTGLETIDLVGKGATGDLKFGNRRTGTTFSHAFDVTENHLKDCDKERSVSQPNLTVKRHFTARNTGQVPIWVTGFEIDGYACEGYGFRVLDCEPFELGPDQQRRINIAFTPDFTLSHITRTLTMKTSLSAIPGKGDVTYALVATVPAHLLSVCAKSLPRPRWEGYLYMLMVCLMVVSLVCVLVAAVMESDRLLHYTYFTCDQVPESARLLDLREVARKTLEEFAERERSVSPAATVIHSNAAGPPVVDLIHTPVPSVWRRFARAPVLVVKYLLGLALLAPPTTPPSLPSSSLRPDAAADSSQQSSPRRTPTEPPVSESSLSSKASSPRTKKKKLPHSQQQPADPAAAGAGTQSNSAPSSKKKKQAKSPVSLDSLATPPAALAATSSPPAITKLTRPKMISTQSSVNDDVDASSTTTESSNPEEISENNIVAKAVASLGSSLPLTSDSAGGAGKKKKRKVKTDEPSQPSCRDAKPMQIKPKKGVERQDSRLEKQDKISRASPKPEQHKPVTPIPAATPPPVAKKQEAKVKGVPKEQTDLRRQQSLPSYDKPPRLQQPPRHESHSGFPSPPSQPLEGFPPTSRADPPRAIIYPELKRENPVNQFGAIGCKVPVNPANNWTDGYASPPTHLALGPPSRTPNGGVAGSPHGLISTPPGGISTMAELQAERRLREEFHHRRILWPGFGPEPGGPVRGGSGGSYIESLWDPPVASTASGGPQQPAPPQHGRWGTIGPNVWPSSVLQYPSHDKDSSSGDTEAAAGQGYGGLGPLSISSIWTSAGQANNKNERDNNTWSSALFKKDI